MPSPPTPVSPVRLFRQYMRWLPDKLGLVNHGAFLLQIHEIKPGDTFIVSYPKSGNTWLRFVIAYMIEVGKNKLTFDEVEKIVPDVYRSKDIIDQLKSPRFIKTHDALLPYYPKSVYIVRDYRDVLVSFYQYKLALKEYTGDFSSFIRSDEVTVPFGSWKEHVSKAVEFSRVNPGRILLLRYEDMKYNFEETVIALAVFCGYRNVDTDSVMEQTLFDNLKQTEVEMGSEFMKSTGKNFFREGKTARGKPEPK